MTLKYAVAKMCAAYGNTFTRLDNDRDRGKCTILQTNRDQPDEFFERLNFRCRKCPYTRFVCNPFYTLAIISSFVVRPNEKYRRF